MVEKARVRIEGSIQDSVVLFRRSESLRMNRVIVVLRSSLFMPLWAASFTPHSRGRRCPTTSMACR